MHFSKLAIASLVSPAFAFWRLPCTSPLVVERADPIVNAGKASGHVHTIMGGNGFGFTMDYDQAMKSDCSSCMVIGDNSNYWVPTLYYRAQDGTFESVPQEGGTLVYYLQRGDEKIQAFPKNFRMLAGDPSLRNYTDTNPQQAISWNCLGPGGETPQIPNKNCQDGLRAQVFFPSCWDGVNLDSADHKSHMSYPIGAFNSGKCPPTHPIRLMSLFYETIWRIDSFKDRWYGNSHPWVLSNGDPTGYGYHGDFVNGWDIKLLQSAIDTCTDDSGVIEKCPVFKFYSDQQSTQCKQPSGINEQISGKLKALPGCNTVQSGPQKAVAAATCNAPGFTGPVKNFVDLTASGWQYIGCGTDDLGTRTLPDRSYSNDMTVEKCISTCKAKGSKFAGLEYTNECYCGNTLSADRAPKPGFMGNCDMPCIGNANEFCGGSKALSIYQACSAGSCKNIEYSIPGLSGSGAAAPVSVSLPAASSSSSTSSTSSTSSPVTIPTLATKVVSTSSSATTTSSSTSSVSASGTSQPPASSGVLAPKNFNVPNGWAYKGCFVDPVNPRLVSDMKWWGVPITNDNCIDTCTKQGYKFAGVEYANECYCGNDLPASAKATKESECNMPCKGNTNELCGGAARINVFQMTKQLKCELV